jgi:uncharacterized membrane protein
VRALYLACVTLHILAAMFWVGGMLFLALVGATALRGVEAGLRRELFTRLGRGFRVAGWAAIAIAVLTGTGALWFRGWLGAMGGAGFWHTAAGRALAIKLAAVLVMVVGSAWHDFVLGPRAARTEPGSDAARRLRSGAVGAARLAVLAAVVAVVAAVRLVRAG